MYYKTFFSNPSDVKKYLNNLSVLNEIWIYSTSNLYSEKDIIFQTFSAKGVNMMIKKEIGKKIYMENQVLFDHLSAPHPSHLISAKKKKDFFSPLRLPFPRGLLTCLSVFQYFSLYYPNLSYFKILFQLCINFKTLNLNVLFY